MFHYLWGRRECSKLDQRGLGPKARRGIVGVEWAGGPGTLQLVEELLLVLRPPLEVRLPHRSQGRGSATGGGGGWMGGG